MTESEFVETAGAVLDAIEAALDETELDVDFERKGSGVLEIELENGSKIIVNLQTPMREIWLAAKSGGYHFRFESDEWRDTRSGDALAAVLSRALSAQAGAAVVIKL
jgi:CyaY protein